MPFCVFSWQFSSELLKTYQQKIYKLNSSNGDTSRDSRSTTRIENVITHLRRDQTGVLI